MSDGNFGDVAVPSKTHESNDSSDTAKATRLTVIDIYYLLSISSWNVFFYQLKKKRAGM